MARNFTGAEWLDFSAGALNGQVFTYGTIVHIVRKGDATGNWRALSSFSGGSNPPVALVEFEPGESLYFSLDSNVTTAKYGTWTDTTKWYCIGITKATGSAAPRAHVYDYSAGTWTHADFDTALADGSSTATQFTIGRWPGGGDVYIGDVEAFGWFRQWVPSDNEFESLGLHASRAAWFSAASRADRAAFWLLDQAASTTSVPDLTGGGANQSAGTAPGVGTSSLGLFGYGAPTVDQLTGQSAGVVAATDDAALSESGVITSSLGGTWGDSATTWNSLTIAWNSNQPPAGAIALSSTDDVTLNDTTTALARTSSDSATLSETRVGPFPVNAPTTSDTATLSETSAVAAAAATADTAAAADSSAKTTSAPSAPPLPPPASRFPGIKFRVAGKLTGTGASKPTAYPPSLSSTVWLDLSTRVTAVEWQTGTPPGPSERLAPGGTWTAHLLNTDRKLDRLNSGSSMYGKLPLGSPVWVQLSWAGATYDAFHGILDEMVPKTDLNGGSWVEMRGYDRLATFAETVVKPTSSTAGELGWQRTDQRFTSIFGKAGVTDTANFDTQPGEALMDASTLGATVGDLLEETLRAEGGESRAFQRRNGKLRFMSANGPRSSTGSYYLQRVYSSGYLRYEELTPVETRDRIRTSATVTRHGSTMGYEKVDSIAEGLYGPRSTAIQTVRNVVDPDARALPDHQVWRWAGDPFNVDDLTVVPGRNPSVIWPSILAQEIMDHIQLQWRTAVNRAANVAGSTYVIDALVTGWSASLDWSEQRAEWRLNLDRAPRWFSNMYDFVLLGFSTGSFFKLAY